MTTYYVIDGDEIINAIECESLTRAEQALTGFTNPALLRLSACPPMTMLKRYRYWDERP